MDTQLPVRQHLEDLISIIAPPTSPLAIPFRAQIRGLALLDAGLRMSHVTRVAEVLKPQDRFSLSREISADLDLTQLAPQTLELLSIDMDDSFRAGDGLPHWIPIARHSRTDLANVDLVLSTGDLLPRMPHRTTLELLCAAFVRMFRMIINSDPQAALPESDVRSAISKFPRSIWLIESALVHYIDDGTMGGVRLLLDGADGGEPVPDVRADQDDHPAMIRERAVALLRTLFEDADDPFFELLRMVSTDFLLVAGLPQGTTITQIRYEAPLLKAHRSAAEQGLSGLRRLLPAGRDFVIDYQSSIPSNAKSFHVSVEEDRSINIRGFALVTNAEASSVSAICQTLTALAGAIESSERRGLARLPSKLIELELQSVIARLGHTVRRRLAELDRFRRYVQQQRGESASESSFRLVPAGASILVPDGAETNSRTALAHLAHLTREHQAGRMTRLADDAKFSAPAHLHRLSRTIEQLDLSTGVNIDNDAREYGAHAHWTRPASADARRVSSQVTATVRMVLTDERPSLTDSVLRMVAALIVIIYLMASFNSGHYLWPVVTTTFQQFVQADAIVAVLFVVPSVLLTRLNIPALSEVLGQLRIFSRTMAYAAVAITATLAIAVSTVDVALLGICFRLAFWSLAVVLLLLQIDVMARKRRNQVPVPMAAPMPRWLLALSRDGRSGTRAADVVFRVNSGALSDRAGRD